MPAPEALQRLSLDRAGERSIPFCYGLAFLCPEDAKITQQGLKIKRLVLMIYVWLKNKEKKKKGFRVHLVDIHGMSLCKAENNGPSTAARMKGRSEMIPANATVCLICRQLSEEPPRGPKIPGEIVPDHAFNAWVKTDGFLRSFQWKEARYKALKRLGLVCMCCGATPMTGAAMMVDHIKPRSKYPELALDPENLQVLCHECNRGKGAWDETDWRRKDETIQESLPEGAVDHLKSMN